MKPVIFGLASPVLSDAEAAFFRQAEPAGFILFARNVVDPVQLRALTDSLRELTGRERLAILVDQEGGPVARLKPPHWPAYPAGPAFDALYEAAPLSAIAAARHNAGAIGAALAAAGITVDCLPLLDVAGEGAAAVIATRALGREPLRVAALGRAVLAGLAAAGVAGVVKHMPGHGRALLDSHLALPTVAADAAALEDDLLPFRRLADAARIGMTAHIVYPAWDADRPATLSPVVVREVIRGAIGFDGLLLTDDIDMKALAGAPADKAAAAIAAGCDLVLDCWARLPEMAAVADRLAPMAERSRERLDAALAVVGMATPVDAGALIGERDALFAAAGVPTGVVKAAEPA